MAKNKRVDFLFTEVPPGTPYRKNHYVRIDEEEAERYASGGFGKVLKLKEKTQPEEVKEPPSDIPEDFPGRNHFLEAGIKYMKDMPKDVTKIEGIGRSTETKIKNYLTDGDAN